MKTERALPRARTISRVGTCLVAAALAALVGCRERRTIRWEIGFADRLVGARSALVLAEVRRGTCAERGERIYDAALAPTDAAPMVPTLPEGAYAFAAISRDARCVEIAAGCADVFLPVGLGDTVRTAMIAHPEGAPVCDACTDGRCEGERDAGMPDAGLDASVPDDAGPDGPPAPRLIAPWNGMATGSFRARDAGVTRAPLRPRLAWARVPGATRYEVQLDDGCAPGLPSACDFAAARTRTLSSTSSARADTAAWIFAPTEDLLPASATRGARVHWRVRACDALACGAWSSEVRWMDVGRDRHDVDGDGRGDLLVGAPGADRGATDAGDVHSFLGTDAGFSPTEAPLDAPPTAAGAWLGSAIALGDLDGDGLADAVISASNADPSGSGAGSLIVLRGDATSGLDTTRPISIAAPDATHARFFGESVAIVDDADGDGFRDVLVGASREGGAGRAYLFHGDGSAVLLAAPAARFDDPAPTTGGRFGFTVAAAYDVDGDGLGDALIGAPFASDAGGAERGRAWLLRASAPASPIALEGPADDDVFFGWSLAGLGDLDEDGYADIAIGAPYEDFDPTYDSDEGRVYVYAGGEGGVDPSSVLARIARSTEYDYVHAGWSIAAGDVDGDGHVDVVVPEPAIDVSSSGPIDRGLLAVHRGDGRGGFEPVATVLYPDDTQASMEYGRSVAVIDANGDGRAEVVGGAHRWNGTSEDAGRVWWHEDPFGADLRGEIAAPTATGSPHFGWALPGSVGRYDTQLDLP